MKTVYMTKGLPASGKSTWAKDIVDKNPNSIKRINKDELRAMLDNNHHSTDAEKFILSVRDNLIMLALENGKHVIIDDTNLASKHEERIRQLIKGKAELVIIDFTDVPVEECIKRDLKRVNSVGEKVIRSMYNQFLLKREAYNEDMSLPKAIIVDIDGTLARMNGRSPFDWGNVDKDECKNEIKMIVNKFRDSHKIIVFSGRDSICRDKTINWLNNNNIEYDGLFMRDQGNNEKDSIIKRRMFEDHVRGKYYVDFVLDDRNQVVEMWRNMGLICLQVAEGDF